MKRGQKIVQLDLGSLMRVAQKGSRSFHAYVTVIVRCPLRADPSQLRHPNSSEGKRRNLYRWGIHLCTPLVWWQITKKERALSLAAKLVLWYKQQCYDDIIFKRGKYTNANTQPISFLISALLLALKGPADVSALFMQIPFCSSVTMEYHSLFWLSSSPARSPSARPPSQELL